jgi:hypothetical protein
MFEMFGKLTVGLSSSLVMARNRSRAKALKSRNGREQPWAV